MINKKWKISLSFTIGTLLGFVNLNFSSFATEGTCDDHRTGRRSMNIQCFSFNCRVATSLSRQTLQQLATEPCRPSQFMAFPQQYSSQSNSYQQPGRQTSSYPTTGDVNVWENNNDTINDRPSGYITNNLHYNKD